jgi:hypothetical protein
MARTDSVPWAQSKAERQMRERLASIANSRVLRDAGGIWLLSRVFFLLLTYFGVILFGSTLHGAHPSFTHTFLSSWNRWDTSWYIDIAQRGYAWHKSVGTYPTAFFPLYPMLLRAGVEITGKSYLLVAMGISSAAFLGALIYLWRLTEWEISGPAARRTVLYVAAFPTALFFFAGYTESLFLFLTVACFFHMRRRDWLLAGLFGGLAAATRVTGVLLAVPFLYEYARYRNFSLRRIDIGLVGLLLVPAGLLAFMVYLGFTVNDPLAFSHHQAAWQKIYTPFLWRGIIESLRQIFQVQPGASFLQAHNLLNLGIGLLFLSWSFFAAKRLWAAYGLYMGAFWLATLASPALAGGYPVPLVSLSRYVLALFPVFMYMGMLGVRRGFHESYLVISTGLLALLTLQFITGGWVV